MSFDHKRYPPHWRILSWALRVFRAGNRCECAGECGRHESRRCSRGQGESLSSGYRVVLTTAHLWRGPCAAHHAAGVKCDDPSHLSVMCQRCHLLYDLPHHVAAARRTRHAAKASGDLFPAP